MLSHSLVFMTTYKILIADDEADILEFVSYSLVKEGYEVTTVSNGREAVSAAAARFDLIILDVMMPEMNGLEACTAIRGLPHHKNTLITFLTARDEEAAQIAGFDAGADDYIPKPIRPRLLVSRVQALLRRVVLPDETAMTLEFDSLSINRETMRIRLDDTEITLARKEFEILYLLASKPDKVFGREVIFASVWGSDVIVGDRTIDVHIRKIREKLNDRFIKTIKGVGYKFEM
jgi:two-component system, OmpR family, alkaline phosphatase synthesis response regulator PhoP